MAQKAPAFQFYVKEYLTDENVIMMSAEQRGCYMDLLCHQWLHRSVPAAVGALARICRVPEEEFAARVWPGLAPCFDEHEGRFVNAKMETQRRDLEDYTESKRVSGRSGGLAKGKQTPSEPIADAKQTSSTDTDSANYSDVANPTSASSSSSASAVRVHAHDAETPKPRSEPPRRSSGVFAGSLPRDHLRHVHCGRKCVPEFLHAEFINGIGGDPDAAAKRLADRDTGLYATVEATLGDRPIGDDPVKFWRAQFAAAFPSVIPKSGGKPEPKYNIPNAADTRALIENLRRPS